jgi:hypothetical protein
MFRLTPTSASMLLFTGTSTSYTLKVDLRNVVSSLPSTTLYASDRVLFNIGISTTANVTLAMTNIKAYPLSSNTQYSLVVYSAQQNGALTSNFSLKRVTTSGAATTVAYGLGYSGAGFINNGAVYSGSQAISFGNSN